MFRIIQKGTIYGVLIGAFIYMLYVYTYNSKERNLESVHSPCIAGGSKTNNTLHWERNSDLEESSNGKTELLSSTDSDDGKTKNMNLYEIENLEELTRGKTKVLRFNGERFERLYEFCTWTQPFHCSMMKVPNGKIPTFHHDPAIDAMTGARLAKDGIRDEREIGIVLRELEKEPDAMFLDLGANIGIYTLTIANTLKRNVIAVEPVIQNAVKLCKSIQENGLTDYVTVVFNPLSDQHTLVDMQKPPTHLSGSKVRPLVKMWTQEISNPTCPKEPPYNTVCLDDLLPYMTSKKAFIKIDVESYEYNAFKGGQRFLDEIDVRSISMEWGHVKKVTDANEFVEMFKRRLYVAYSTNGRVLEYKKYKKWPWDVVWRKQDSGILF